MPSATYGSVPFTEQIAFFRRKLNIPTRAWTDIYTAEHDWAFMVAGANRDDVLTGFRQVVEKAIAQGSTLEDFRKDFDRIVARTGWDYNGGREWRSRVIYETNLFGSYSAGRFEQLWADRETLPYWQYHHNDSVTHPREHHLAWDGTILRADNPWWRTHFTPNGWGCQCYITGLSEFDLRRMGRTVDQAPDENLKTVEIGQRSPGGPRRVQVPEGIDPGFEYTPGRSRIESAMPPLQPTPPAGGAGLPSRRASEPLPEPGPAPSLLPQDVSRESAVDAFLEYFDAVDEPKVFRDVVGERLAIGRNLFVDAGTGRLQLPAAEPRLLPLAALAVIDPDEIWVRLEWDAETGKAQLLRRYITRLIFEGRVLLAALERGAYGWSASVGEHDDDPLRVGVRLYRRDEEQ